MLIFQRSAGLALPSLGRDARLNFSYGTRQRIRQQEQTAAVARTDIIVSHGGRANSPRRPAQAGTEGSKLVSTGRFNT